MSRLGLAGLAALVLFAMTPVVSDDAEARGFRVRSGAATGAAARALRSKEREETESNAAASDTDEDTPAQTEPTKDGAAAGAGKAKSPAPRLVITEAQVPGCPPGMLCTVCVAGCVTGPNSIVHAEPKLATARD
jgi:hypothetical protein